jgi:hypothetical protein
MVPAGRLEFRAPLSVRLLGIWICVVGLAALVGTSLSGASGGIVAGAVFAVAAVYTGSRAIRLAVVCQPEALILRNRYLTRRIPWTDVTAVASASGTPRSSGGRMTGGPASSTGPTVRRSFSMPQRRSRYGWPYRTLFSLPKADAQDRVSAVHDFWKSVQREGP